MLASLLFALVMMGILALLLARFPARRRATAQLSPSVVRALTLDLLRAMGLELVGWDEDVLIASRKEPFGDSRYVVVLGNGDVDQAGVLAAAESIKSEGAARGMLIAPGVIETAGLASLDVALTLVDGAEFRRLVARHLPGRLPEINRAMVVTPASTVAIRGRGAIRREPSCCPCESRRA